MRKVREISKEAWDDLVKESEQGTIFCCTKWLELYEIPYKLYGCFNGDNLLGGVCGFTDSHTFNSGELPLIPFQGILVAPVNSPKYTTLMSRHQEVATTIRDFLSDEYKNNVIRNHYSFPDTRPFIWKGWRQGVHFTYVLDTTDRKKMWSDLEKQTRYEITSSSGVMRQWSLQYFDELYADTFTRKDMNRPISKEFLKKLNDSFDCRIVGTNHAMAYVVWDDKRAYYILGASDGTGSAAEVWTMLEGVSGMGLKELDFVGANDEQIGRFKKGFGGELKSYYSVSL
jgi:hypothetical protein